MNAILCEYLLSISDSCSKNVQSLNQFNIIITSHIIHIRIQCNESCNEFSNESRSSLQIVISTLLLHNQVSYMIWVRVRVIITSLSLRVVGLSRAQR